MKKSLIALAVIAASGTAMAQSSVTLYGTVDAFAGVSKSGVAGARVSQNVVNGGGIKESRFGFKGSEDLGGGLKANFHMEQRFDTSTGGQIGAMYKGRSMVGLSGGFGEVKIGREYTMYDDVRGGFAGGVVFDAGTFSPVGDVFKLSDDYSARADNQIRYVTPNFSGFTLGLSYGLGEDKTTNTKASHIGALSLNYANGPLKVGYSYQSEKSSGRTGLNVAAAQTAPAIALTPAQITAAAAEEKYNFLGASYDLGMVKLTGMYQNRKQANFKDNDFAFGVDVPMGAFTLAVGYASAEQKNGSFTNAKATGWGVLGSYALSKRTDVYAGLKATEVKKKTIAGAAYAKTLDNDVFGLGVRHSF